MTNKKQEQKKKKYYTIGLGGEIGLYHDGQRNFGDRLIRALQKEEK